MNTILSSLASCLLLALSATAAVTRFPAGGWTGATVKRGVDSILVADAVGRQLVLVSGPRGAVAKIAVAVRTDHLEIDCREALSGSADKIALYGPPVDAATVAGRCALVRTVLEGPSGTKLIGYFEGLRRDAAGQRRHYFVSKNLYLQGVKKSFDFAAMLPPELCELHFRWDILKQNGLLRLYAAEMGTVAEIAPHVELPPPGRPELLFRAPYDGSPEAAEAGGSAKPLQASGIEYVPGVRGQAALVKGAKHGVLKYAIPGNVIPEHGTAALWVKRQWYGQRGGWRSLFAFPHPSPRERLGSGQLWLWFYDGTLRCDAGDDDDTVSMYDLPLDDDWHFVAFVWHERGVWLFVDGKRVGRRTFAQSPVELALRTPDRLSFSRVPFDSFFVGNCSGGNQADCAIDEFRIWSAPLDEKELRTLWEAERPCAPRSTGPDWATKMGDDRPNAYEAPAAAAARPGVPQLELVESLTLDAATIGRLTREKRFASVGATRFGRLDGRDYLEAGSALNDRFALRFAIDPAHPLYCFEIDWPDDAVRTADLIVQKCKGSVWDGANGADYALQVGYASGDEYPNSGRVRTHRCLYWSQVADISLQAMTARKGDPAAIAAVRLYRVKDGKLPVADIREPRPNKDGWRRSFCLYFEDPAIEYDFARQWNTPKGFREVIDRTAALMKFTGQNLFAYPGAWYQGLIGGDDGYNPRRHPDDYLTAWYTRFDREGLSLVPTVNIHDMAVRDGLLTRTALGDGSLHASPLAIHADGLTGFGGTHNSLSGYCFLHPDVQAMLERTVDALVGQGAAHPSFKGVCLHLTRYNMLWFGDWLSGYNDYVVEAFCLDRGLSLPASIDRTDPLRGKAYYQWLKAERWQAWLDWRCDQVTAFWAKVAKKMAARRPDLKLWFNSFAPPDITNPDFAREDYLRDANVGAGLDGRKLTAAIPNAILCQTQVPADYRWRSDRSYLKPEFRRIQRDFDTKAGFWELLEGAAYPWVNQHDRYWEDAIGRTTRGIAGKCYGVDWLDECPWRVTTVNPTGRHALRHFVEAFRHSDVLGLSKGGFLIGTYGMEDELVPFARAFRALPAVVMEDAAPSRDGVVMRQADFDGCSYFYLCNTTGEKRRVAVSWPAGTEALSGVSAGPTAGAAATVDLKPYELRSYAAPSGKPNWK